jgi:hypothetical protein|tara:strand:- start:94 stop:360 length:267 start_codon:yes stop_codon:yes gene_type:complete
MQYQILKRTTFSGSTPDMLSHVRTATTLRRAIEYKVHLEALEDDKERHTFEIHISIQDAYKYVTAGSESDEPLVLTDEVKEEKIVNFK